MKVYSVLESITFLKDRYGRENMPSCEETLRRAIRTGDLKVQETGDPGRKGYAISEDNLIAYAEKRMRRLGRQIPIMAVKSETRPGEIVQEKEISKFPEVYRQYIEGKLEKEQYFLKLYSEKIKWESLAKKHKERLAQIEMERLRIENEIQDCQSSIEAFDMAIRTMNT